MRLLGIRSFVCMSCHMADITIMNRYGESGHPCLIPLCCSCEFDTFPLNLAWNIVFVYIADTAVSISVGARYLVRVAIRAVRSMRSKAFSQSMNTIPICCPLLSALSMILRIHCIASVVELFFGSRTGYAVGIHLDLFVAFFV